MEPRHGFQEEFPCLYGSAFFRRPEDGLRDYRPCALLLRFCASRALVSGIRAGGELGSDFGRQPVRVVDDEASLLGAGVASSLAHEMISCVVNTRMFYPRTSPTQGRK